MDDARRRDDDYRPRPGFAGDDRRFRRIAGDTPHRPCHRPSAPCVTARPHRQAAAAAGCRARSAAQAHWRSMPRNIEIAARFCRVEMQARSAATAKRLVARLRLAGEYFAMPEITSTEEAAVTPGAALASEGASTILRLPNGHRAPRKRLAASYDCLFCRLPGQRPACYRNINSRYRRMRL